MCSRDAAIRGLCRSHYQQHITRGRPLAPLQQRSSRWPDTCRFRGADGDVCGRGSLALGLCASHYRQQNRGLDLTPLRRPGGRPARRDSQGRRQCYRCKEWFPPEEFFGYCRRCAQLGTRARLHGLTPGEWTDILDRQGGACRGCGETAPKAWHTDHDHACCPGEYSCGKCVRGILCQACNVTLGMARDSVERLRGLIKYLEEWSPA